MKPDPQSLLSRAEADCAGVFSGFSRTERVNTARVLDAFEKNRIGARHFAPSTGYGYDDIGRDTLEKLTADIFHTEEAIFRPQLSGGTHTLAICLFGLLLPGDELLAATGKPYDTLDSVIGTHGQPGSLMEMGVSSRQAELTASGELDIPGVLTALTQKTRVVLIQRSRGYSVTRPAISPSGMAPQIKAVKAQNPDIFILVDNCYGAFVNPDEPTFYGADAVAGSLIKNLGGGLAPTGGYVAGTRRAIARIEARLTAPGLGREVGSFEGSYRPFYQGLFMAPHTVCQALKVAALAARAAELLGFETQPAFDAPRADIIQALLFHSHERVIAYCQGIQSGSPVDAYATPEPWDMPGYLDQIIMAAGTFVQGASIELSCDAPMRAPFAVYQQGALTYESGRRALVRAFSRLLEEPREGMD